MDILTEEKRKKPLVTDEEKKSVTHALRSEKISLSTTETPAAIPKIGLRLHLTEKIQP